MTYSYTYETRERLEVEFKNGESLADWTLQLLNGVGLTGRRVVNIASFERSSDKFIGGDPLTIHGITLIVEQEQRDENG